MRLGVGRPRWGSQDNDGSNIQYNALSPDTALSPPPSWSEPNNKRQKRHHQQSRTIFRCVSGESAIYYYLSPNNKPISGENNERDCDSRSTIASPFSDTSQSQLQQDFSANQNANSGVGFSQQMLEDAYGMNQPNLTYPGDRQGLPPDKLKPQVWKLSENSPLDPSPLPQLNTFTLQETLFVEQLTAIDERVRFQVSNCSSLNKYHTTH